MSDSGYEWPSERHQTRAELQDRVQALESVLWLILDRRFPASFSDKEIVEFRSVLFNIYNHQ